MSVIPETQDQQVGTAVSTPGGPRRQLYQLGKALYRAVPSRVRARLYPIAANAVLLRRLRPEIWVLTGEEKSSHLPLSVCLYVTNQEYKSNLENVIFDSCQGTYLGRGWLWNAFKALPAGAAECSIVVAEVHERHLKWVGKNAGIVIPAWIRGHVPLPRSPAVMKNLNVKRIFRRVRQHDLSYEITRDPRRFDDFFYKMYIPYSKARFGERAFVYSIDKVREMFGRGELLMVSKGDECVVGQLLVYEKDDSAVMPFQGVLDGNREYVTAGAVEAAYEFTLEHLEKNGYRSVSFGQTQAFLNDGILQFKRRYGHIVSSAIEHKYVARVMSDTPVARAFLKSNPFIFQLDDGLRGVVFLDREDFTPQKLEEVYKDYFHPGLLEIIVVVLSADGSRACGPAPEDVTSELTMPTTDSGPEYRRLTKAEYGPLIGPLGELPIAAAAAVRPPPDHA